MRKVTYGAACSFDGYIARADGAVDWLHWSDDVLRLTSAYWDGIDTVLMGRKTYEMARALGSGAYPGVENFVFSRTLHEDPEPGMRLVRDDASQFVDRLKRQSGRGICVMGGGALARTLFEADLIDEVGANIHPVLLGGGVRLFQRLPREIRLELLQLERIAGGCVYVLYGVRGKGRSTT